MKAFEHDTHTYRTTGTTRCLPASDNVATTEPCSLVHAVQAAVRAVNASSLKPVAPPEAGALCQSRTLLALLSYNYARQVYSSVDIENAMRSDAELGRICHDQLPDAQILFRFRRENREALQLCLKVTLRYLVEKKVADGVVTRVSEAYLGEEANRRIITAMFTDSMEMKGGRTSDPPADLCYLFAKGRAQVH